MNNRLAPPTSSRSVFTRANNSSFDPLPSTFPVIGMTTKSLISSVACATAVESHDALTASVRHAIRRRLSMVCYS